MKNIYIAGHRGMVGSAVLRHLDRGNHVNLITRTRSELNLLNQEAVRVFFESESIDEVYLCAAKVGGICANNEYPYDFIYQNLQIQCNIIDSALRSGVKKLLFLGSSCIYPRLCKQPIFEEYLLDGVLEKTNEPYALAKISGIKMIESIQRQFQGEGFDYRALMPTNLYGPMDNYHPDNSHVVAGLIRRIYEAKALDSDSVTIWGTGLPRREFLYVDDLASAAVKIMSLERTTYDQCLNGVSHVNIGTGEDISIIELANLIKKVVGFDGQIVNDPEKPDGTPRKLLNVDRASKMGWKAETKLYDGLVLAYGDFLNGLKGL